MDDLLGQQIDSHNPGKLGLLVARLLVPLVSLITYHSHRKGRNGTDSSVLLQASLTLLGQCVN